MEVWEYGSMGVLKESPPKALNDLCAEQRPDMNIIPGYRWNLNHKLSKLIFF